MHTDSVNRDEILMMAAFGGEAWLIDYVKIGETALALV